LRKRRTAGHGQALPGQAGERAGASGGHHLGGCGSHRDHHDPESLPPSPRLASRLLSQTVLVGPSVLEDVVSGGEGFVLGLAGMRVSTPRRLGDSTPLDRVEVFFHFSEKGGILKDRNLHGPILPAWLGGSIPFPQKRIDRCPSVWHDVHSSGRLPG